MNARPAIAVVEDDRKVREYLAHHIELAVDTREVCVFYDAETALSELSRKPVDIALFDINLPGMNGIECIRRIKMIHPGMQCMVLTVYDDADTIFDAIRAGAVSYLLKSTPPERIVEAIHEVQRGGSSISSQIARKIIETFAAKGNANQHYQLLSRREQEIITMLSKGFRYKEIADKLFISIETVRTHVRNVYEKLQVNSRIEALKKTGLW